MDNYILSGKNVTTRVTLYYTGKAGAGWLSPHRADAFVYQGCGSAWSKMTAFNRMTALHGYDFAVVTP